MRTLCLLGSPRRGGNSDLLAERFGDQARRRGAQVERIALSELTYDGCRNLFRCKRDLDHCGQADELTPVLAAIQEAQVLVLASPVYFTNLTGQLKSAIDRFFSFLVPDYPNKQVKSRLSPGRSLVLIQSQGEAEERYRDLLESYAPGFTHLGFERHYLIRAWGVREAGEVAGHPAILARCDQVAAAVYGESTGDAW